MNDRVEKIFAPIALGAAALFAVFMCGCTDEEQPAAPSQTVQAQAGAAATNTAPVVGNRLEDPAYRKVIDEQIAEQEKLQKTCSRVRARMAAREKTIRDALKTDDEAVIKAALEKDSEYRSLSMRMDDAKEALEDNVKKSRAIVRDRLLSEMPKQKRQ